MFADASAHLTGSGSEWGQRAPTYIDTDRSDSARRSVSHTYMFTPTIRNLRTVTLAFYDVTQHMRTDQYIGPSIIRS
jgi:hypothetical protein